MKLLYKWILLFSAPLLFGQTTGRLFNILHQGPTPFEFLRRGCTWFKLKDFYYQMKDPDFQLTRYVFDKLMRRHFGSEASGAGSLSAVGESQSHSNTKQNLKDSGSYPDGPNQSDEKNGNEYEYDNNKINKNYEYEYNRHFDCEDEEDDQNYLRHPQHQETWVDLVVLSSEDMVMMRGLKIQYAKMAEALLEQLKEFRLAQILEHLRNKLSPDSEGQADQWVRDSEYFQSTEIEGKFDKVLSLFPGSKLYLKTGEGIFVFNFFGSDTPTSDLDYGLYLLTRPAEQLDFREELRKVTRMNAFIVQAARSLVFALNRRGVSLQELLDLNGYPDMFVVYNYFFRGQALNDRDLDWVFNNSFSSVVLRLCLDAHIHPYVQ